MPESRRGVGPAITVIGVGNTILQDEGAGVHMCRHLEKHWSCTPPVAFQNGGTSGLGITDLMAGYEIAIILDTILLSAPPGTLKVLKKPELLKPVSSEGLAGHALGLKKGLEFARLAGDLPKEVVLVAIVPAIIEYGEELSSQLKVAMGNYANAVSDLLKTFGVVCLKKKDGDKNGAK